MPTAYFIKKEHEMIATSRSISFASRIGSTMCLGLGFFDRSWTPSRTNAETNDVARSGGEFDPQMLDVAAEFLAPIVLMHM